MWPEPEATQAILEAALRGAEGAVDSLLERHRAALRRFVALRLDRALDPRLDASDVVQDVCLAASARLADYLRERKLPFHLWLRCLASDRIADAHRLHRAGKRSVDREEHLGSAALADRSTLAIVAEIRDLGPSPVTLALRHELALRLDQALRALRPDDREIVIMRHHEHLSNQEAAALLGIAESTAAMRYVRALRRLRAQVEGGGSA